MSFLANISFITDEVSPSLEEAIDFAHQNNLQWLEMRSVNNVNLMNLSLSEVENIANIIDKHCLKVSCFASPLLKWLPPGKTNLKTQVNWHGYNLSGDEIEEVFTKAMAMADILSTKYIRIFSYLKYPDFKFSDLNQDWKKLLDLAEKHDKILVLENEPVCNVITLLDQFKILSDWHHPRLKALLDIGNLYQAGENVKDSDLKRLAPYITYLHIKDYSWSDGSYVPLGTGSVLYEQYFAILNEALSNQDIYISLETHVNSNPWQATQLSLLWLQKLINKNV